MGTEKIDDFDHGDLYPDATSVVFDEGEDDINVILGFNPSQLPKGEISKF